MLIYVYYSSTYMYVSIFIYMQGIQRNPYLKYFGRCHLQSLYKCHKFTYYKYKVKSATLQKFPMKNIHNKLNIF